MKWILGNKLRKQFSRTNPFPDACEPPINKPASSSGSSYIPALDGFRAVSIAIVFLSHAGVSDLIPGGFGVTVFFFLSGFLITTLLTREQDKHGRISLRAFYLRRLLRLSPPILIAMFAATVVVFTGLAAGDLAISTYLSQLFFYYNYHMLMTEDGSSVEGFNVLWSLSVEEHFYLIWPVLFIAIARGWFGINGIVLLLAAILVWRLVRMVVFGHGEWKIYISTDTRFDSLLYGCLLALLVWRGHAERLFPAALPARAFLICMAFAILLISFLVQNETFRSTLRYTLQGIALMPLFFYATRRPQDLLFKPLNWSPVRMVGMWSYTIYLCHLVIIEALIYNDISQLGEPLLIVLSAALSCGFSALVYRFAEKPLKPLRARLTGH